MNANGDNCIFAILFLKIMNFVCGIRTIDATLTSEVLNEYASIYLWKRLVYQAVFFSYVVARDKSEGYQCGI